MSACFRLPTFHQRLFGNFGILSILSIVSLVSLVISQKLKDSPNQIQIEQQQRQQQQQQTSWIGLDCTRTQRDNNEDLLQSDTSDGETEPTKLRTNFSANCMSQKQLIKSTPPNSRQQNANNHELATSIEPIYFERYSSSAAAAATGNDRSNFPTIYDENQMSNPLTSSFYMLGPELPQFQDEKNRELTEPTSDARSNYSYNGSNPQHTPSKLPFVKVNNELDLPSYILKPFEQASPTTNHREPSTNLAKRFAIPLAELAHKQFELSGIYGIKQDDKREFDTQKLYDETKPPNRNLSILKQSKPANTIQNERISAKVHEVDQQVRIPMSVLHKIQTIKKDEEKSVSNLERKVANKKRKLERENTKSGGKYLNDLYRSSILKRLKQKPGTGTIPANISNLLKPGEVLLAEKKIHDNRKQVANNEVAAVKPSDIVGLLRKLKPLTVSEYEKPEAEKVDHENRGIDDDFELEKEEVDELKRQNKVHRVLPTSHLFGGSVGVVNETKIRGTYLGNKEKNEESDNNGELELNTDNEDNDEQDDDNQQNSPNKKKLEDLQFLKVLTDLGSTIGKEPHSEDEIQPIDGEFYELYGNKNKNNNKLEKKRETTTTNNGDHSNADSHSNDEHEKTVPPIAIEALVDHLMSSSRLATFGVQHTGVKVPRNNDVYEEDHEPPSNDEEEDEEEEEDGNSDDDADNNDTLPPIGEKEAESNLSETKVLPSFDSVASMSDTWIPLDSVEVNNKQLLSNKNSNGQKSGAKVNGIQEVPSKRKKSDGKRRKRRRRRKRNNRQNKKKKGDLVLIIGDKMLSRTDLIRLIRVLNKMSSKKEASREREASRRLLRFLVKLALEEYTKNKESNSNDGLNDPIREVLRSILSGPIYGKESDHFKDANITNSGEIQLKPLTPTILNNLNEEEAKYARKAQQSALNETKKETPRKSLTDVTDDLDLYFESDFFEDLADKRDNSSKRALPDNIQITKLKLPENQKSNNNNNNNNKRLKKLKRASRLGYSLPVPIYGKQYIEAADEDDVELDHIRLKRRPTKRRSAPRRPSVTDDNDNDDDNEDDELASKRSPRRSRKRSREIKTEAPPEEDEEEEQRVDLTQDPEPDEESTTTLNGNSIMKLNNPAHFRRTNRNTKLENSNRTPKNNDDNGEPDPSSVITGEVDSDIDSQDDPDSEPDRVPGAENIEAKIEPSNRVAARRKRRRRKRKRRQRVANSGARRKLAPENEVDLDDRDEIPAPIAGETPEYNDSGAGKRLRTKSDYSQLKNGVSNEVKKIKRKITSPKRDDENKQQQQHQQQIELNTKTAERKPLNTSLKQTTKGKTIGPTKIRKLNKEDRPRKRNARHKSAENNKVPESDGKPANDSNYLSLDEPASEELEPNIDNSEDQEEVEEAKEPQDKDYYNEGTSYSKVCEDDGKCHVSVQSSSPKLSEAIKARDKPSIVKHLGNWVSQND